MGENMVDLTKITTPFGLLDKETQEALKAHGGPYECFDAYGDWLVIYDPSWIKGTSYRVKPQPPTKPSIDWSHVAPQYKWLARDKNGDAWFFDDAPRIEDISVGMWVFDGDEIMNAKAFASYTPGTCDWRDSLVERPE